MKVKNLTDEKESSQNNTEAKDLGPFKRESVKVQEEKYEQDLQEFLRKKRELV